MKAGPFFAEFIKHVNFLSNIFLCALKPKILGTNSFGWLSCQGRLVAMKLLNLQMVPLLGITLLKVLYTWANEPSLIWANYLRVTSYGLRMCTGLKGTNSATFNLQIICKITNTCQLVGVNYETKSRLNSLSIGYFPFLEIWFSIYWTNCET